MLSFKKIVLAFSLASFFSPLIALADVIEVPSPVEKVFVPNGFDDNDNVEVILHGYYRNSCYKVGKISSKIDTQKHLINVTATSYKVRGVACLYMMVPFMQTHKFGLLDSGKYTVIVNNNDKTANFTVKNRVSETMDDYFYAPVASADFKTDELDGAQSIDIRGEYPLMLHGCAVLEEVRVLRDSPDTVVVLPIMNIHEDGPCDLVFKKTINLDKHFEGEGLLHIRSLNGNSFNKIIKTE